MARPSSMAERLLEIDEFTGTKHWFSYDELTNETTIRTEWLDAEPAIERNRRLQNDTDHSRKGEWWYVGHIPNAIIAKWHQDYGIDVFNKDHRDAVLKKLDDPEWRYLRTGLGRIGRHPTTR